ncbi:MAG: FtsQ-type POTRA domain-containing protein [Nannocystaceae bacterium]|nr:FtsQ-type POTRA domain-containing protein [Nannocystaceae bacterium]
MAARTSSRDRTDLRTTAGTEKAARGKGSPPRRGAAVLRRAAKIGLRLAISGTVAWALLAGAREGYDYATTSPRFEVRALTFEPTAHIDDESVRTLMALPPGTNILSLDLEAVAGRIAAHPWVAEASVVRVLPDALDIEVVEFEARAMLLASTPMLVDATGHAFKRVEDGERGRLPIITGIDDALMRTAPHDAGARMVRALEALDGWDAKRRPRLGEIHVADAGEVTLYTAEIGTQLLLGRGDLSEALLRYDALRAALGDDSDTLAVVHLDHTPVADRPARVIATFLPTASPELVLEAQAQAEARALQAQADAASAQDRKQRQKRKRRGQRQVKKLSRLPKYE